MSVVRQRYNAIVTRNNDPNGLGRIRVKCSDIASGELPWWIRPLLAQVSTGSGWFMVPEVDSRVMIELAVADTRTDARRGETLISDPDPVYIAAPWGPMNTPPAQFDAVTKRGFVSASGHYIIFDDAGSVVTIQHGDGSSYVELAAGGNVIIHGTSSVKIDKDADQSLVRGEDLKTWLLGHNHPTGVGPSGPAQAGQLPWNDGILSSNHKVK